MIKRKEEIKEKAMKRMEEVVDDLIKKMDEGSNGDFFPIDDIEEITLAAQKEAVRIILEESNRALNNIEEQEIIDKKKHL